MGWVNIRGSASIPKIPLIGHFIPRWAGCIADTYGIFLANIRHTELCSWTAFESDGKDIRIYRRLTGIVGSQLQVVINTGPTASGKFPQAIRMGAGDFVIL